MKSENLVYIFTWRERERERERERGILFVNLENWKQGGGK
jgi:hypothetical protein